MKNKLLMFLLVSVLSFSNLVPTFALPNEEQETEAEAQEDADTVVLDDEEFLEDEEVAEGETNDEVPDWMSAEPIVSTTKDEVNNSQLVFSCVMPEYFNLGAYVEMVNRETGDLYRMIATAKNRYKNVMFLPEGSYMVVSVGIVGDDMGTYPMVPVEDFELTENSMTEISSTLMNFDEIQKEAYKRMGLLEGVTETEEVLVETEETDSKWEEETVTVPWRVITALNEGSGKIELSGTSSFSGDVVIEIMETGSVNEGEFRYSLDGGETWSENKVIASKYVLTEVIEEYETSTGLELNFFSDQEYISGDKYTYTAEHEYETSNSGNINVGQGMIRLTTDGVIYSDEIVLTVVITKTGNNNEAFFKYSLYEGGAYTESIPIPKSGQYDIIVNQCSEKE